MAYHHVIEPMSEGRILIQGIVFTFSVIEVLSSSTSPETVGNRDITMMCGRCGTRWSKTLVRSDLKKIYQHVPRRCSAFTIISRSALAKSIVLAWVDGHICMPTGYAGISTSVLERVDPSATKAEQYEALATAIGQLAADEGA